MDISPVRELTIKDLPDGHYAVMRGGEWLARLTVLRPVGVVAEFHDGCGYSRSRNPLTDRGLRLAVRDAALSPNVDGRIGAVIGTVDGVLVAALHD